LAMVQRFVKNMGGQVKLSNQQPHGARVCLMFPVSCLLVKA
jgi:two-component system NtrC family sensor kinase